MSSKISQNTNRMTAETWARLETIFNTAFELDGEERERYLAEACGDDVALRREVESLLSSVHAEDTAIERMIGEAAEHTIEQQADATGVHIGPYRVVRTLGTGGMGSVYLAKRDDKQFRQRVAIKLVNSFLVNPETRARFLAEREILATLEHPHIARLLDGGDTEEGAPYLVMEYIRGLPVTAFCDRNNLTIDERLELFRKICEAVHFAHQNLVVHRDIKPGNILVTRDGTPKLLDFGIAKILDTERFDRTIALTQLGDRLLTPENASPEQVLGRPVTTASDVYSLGVLFYELLAGRRPHDLRGLSPGEMERTICEVDPVPPSTTVTGAPRPGPQPDAAAIAEARGTTPERLRRALSGDLDNIVLAALRKEPDRRYGSAFALAEDVRRHQEGEPIWARKDTWSYRTGKFLQRHTFGVATAAAAMVALVVFAAMMYVQANRIAREADIKSQVIEYIISVFEVADPSEARGRTFTAEEIVDRGAKQIAMRDNLDPQVRATIMDTIGKVYSNLGFYDKAVPLLEEALQARRESMPSGHKDIAASLMNLGETRHDSGQWDEALVLLEEALEINRRANGNEHESVARTLHAIGSVWRLKDELDLAETHYRDSLELYTRLFGGEDDRVGQVLSDLAHVERIIGNLEEAETLGRRALEINRRKLGDDHPIIIFDLNSLAATLKGMGRFDEAWTYYQEAVASAERIYADNLTHQGYITTVLNIGQFHLQAGNLGEAEAAFREVLRLERQQRGDIDTYVAYDMTELARVLSLRGSFAEAEQLARGALDIYAQTLADDHVFVATPLTTLGAVLTETGRAADAEDYLRRALAIHEGSDPPKPVPMARTQGELGETLTALGRYDEAEPLLRASFDTLSENGGEGDAEAVAARDRLLRLYDLWVRPEAAEALRSESGSR
ncbi:MAG: serine/threonine-protein kinase [Pseudomonadota bacterium]